jgi:hypothetical protein
MSNDFLMSETNVSTASKSTGLPSMNYANKHTSPSGPAASNASNSNRKRGRFFRQPLRYNRHLSQWPTSTHSPRMHSRKNSLGLRSNSGSKAIGLLFLILTTPFSSAMGLGDFTASSAEIQGNFEATGALAGIVFPSFETRSSFEISGNATIETEFVNRFVADQVGIATDDGTQRSTAVLSSALLEIQETGDFMIYNVAGPTTISGFDSTISPQSTDIVWGRSFDLTRDSPKIYARETITGESSNLNSLTISGTFSVSFWDGSFDSEGIEYWAGERSDIEEQGFSAGNSRGQIVHVDIQNGSLSSRNIQTSSTRIWEKAAFLGMDKITLRDTSNLSGSVGGELESYGFWSMGVSGGDSIEVTNFQGETPTFDGAVIQDQSSENRWWVLIFIPFTLGLLAVAPSNRRTVQRMERELSRSRYELVAKHRTRRLLKSKYARRGSLYRATALLAMGAYQEAGLFLRSLAIPARPDAGTYHLLNAQALAGIGSKDEAARELAMCLALVPSYGTEASQMPLLAPLLGRAYALSPDYA